MEDYPSPAEGNGLENRQACKSVRGFESHILLNSIAGWSSSVARRAHNPKVVGSNPAPAIEGSVAQLVEQWIEAPCVGGSIPSRAISFIFLGRVAKRLNAADCKSAPSGSGVRIPPLPYYGHSLKVELRSPKPSVWVQFLLPVLVKWRMW